MKVPAISVPEVDTFGSHKHRKIRVWKDPKFSACCDMMAKLDLPTDAAWKLLTHVDNYKILSALKRTNPRKYLKRGIFEVVYDVEHVQGWRLLWLSGEFVTKLRVKENRGNKSVSFKLLKSDVMNDFDGSWKLQPCTQAGLNKLYGKGGNPFDGLVGLLGGRQANSSLLEFNQQVEPKSAPAPLKGLVRRIATGALKRTMDDLEAEAVRIKKGKPTLEGFEQWAENAVPKDMKKEVGKGVKDFEKGFKDVKKGVKDFQKDVYDLSNDAKVVAKDAEAAIKDVKATVKTARRPVLPQRHQWSPPP